MTKSTKQNAFTGGNTRGVTQMYTGKRDNTMVGKPNKVYGYPEASGLFNPMHEKDACGMGFVVHIKGQASHAIVEQALTVLENMEHRGGQGSESNTGDGAGIMLQVPHAFLQAEMLAQGVTLPPRGAYAVGMLFLPQDAKLRARQMAELEQIVAEEGQTVLGWREVPTDDRTLGKTSAAVKPYIGQIFVGKQSDEDRARSEQSVIDDVAKAKIIGTGSTSYEDYMAMVSEAGAVDEAKVAGGSAPGMSDEVDLPAAGDLDGVGRSDPDGVEAEVAQLAEAADSAAMAFERKLYVIRKRAEREIRLRTDALDVSEGEDEDSSFYFSSLSARTIVYKGMLTTAQVKEFYLDLTDERVETAIALVHSRFSTNTFPSWERAHPYRYVIHNGEINTLRGNVNWMHARQSLFASELFGEDIEKIKPVVAADGSDTANFDNTLELLYLAGRSLPHAAMMMVPEPWQRNTAMSASRRAFYEFHSHLMEAWDGPASMAFTDGELVGAFLDRNGLRPSRYYVTKDDMVVLASEAGVVDIAPERVLRKERLRPGRMLLIDTRRGKIISDERLKEYMAAQEPYQAWLDEHLIALADLPEAPRLPRPVKETVQQRQQAFGYTYEDLQKILQPMAMNGEEPTASMGYDAPLAVLSEKPQRLYNYFKQLFAQVTNPPIDAIREEMVTSTSVSIGPERNLLAPEPESARHIKMETPILSNADFAKLRHVRRFGFKSITLPIVFEASGGEDALRAALDGMCAAADRVIGHGHNILILSDRGLDAEWAPIPALLAVSALHHHLIREGTRTRVSILLESGEPREVHHYALLLGYGVSAINPYLVFESLDDMIRSGLVSGMTLAQAEKNYLKAATKGVMKILSKMGISTIQSYRGAQIFEAIGLNRAVIDEYFTWTESRIGGIGLDVIARDTLVAHERAYSARSGAERELDSGGEYQWRAGGEEHLFSPATIHTLQQATRTGDYKLYKKFSALVQDEEKQAMTLRSLLEFKVPMAAAAAGTVAATAGDADGAGSVADTVAAVAGDTEGAVSVAGTVAAVAGDAEGAGSVAGTVAAVAGDADGAAVVAGTVRAYDAVVDDARAEVAVTADSEVNAVSAVSAVSAASAAFAAAAGADSEFSAAAAVSANVDRELAHISGVNEATTVHGLGAAGELDAIGVRPAGSKVASGTVRGSLVADEDWQPVPLEEVEPARAIVKRFVTGAMSYGSISQEAHEAMAIAMNRLGGKSNTGEGGENPERYTPDANGDSRRSAIKQVASGRFGVSSHYLVNADEIQIKLAQGAKPGEGGQLPGKKVYPWVAECRNSTPGVGLISPPPHHDIYSIEDLAELIHDLKNANPRARISVKLVSEVGVGTIAAGVAKCRADHILISGYDGGTGASPLNSVRHAGLPWELGLAETHQTLLANKLRDRVVLQTDGKLMTGRDLAIAALLGAEEFGFSTAPLIVLGCVMMRVCQLDTCPVGIATQNPALRKYFGGKPDFIVNYMLFVAEELREIMASLGFRTVEEMVGRVDRLQTKTALDHYKLQGLDLSPILASVAVATGTTRYHTQQQDHRLEHSLDMTELLAAAEPALERGASVTGSFRVRNIHRAVGTIVGSEVTRRYGKTGLPADTIRFHLRGSAGQSFGAFVPHGMTLTLEGDSNDYIGKGLSGGKLIVRPDRGATFCAEENIICGNTAFYGAVAGEAYIRGIAGERFGVRNSGAHIVVEGVGDHGCEYMTGGRVVVLGSTGRNFAAGMSGGVAYVYDPAGTFSARCNTEMVLLERIENPIEAEEVHAMITRHADYTGSSPAQRILADWEPERQHFVRVIPKDYKRMLEQIERAVQSGLEGDAAVLAAFEATTAGGK